MGVAELLDEMSIGLVEACEANNWKLIQRSAVPEGTRTFMLLSGNKRVNVALTNVRTTADETIGFNYGNGGFPQEQMVRIIARAFERI